MGIAIARPGQFTNVRQDNGKSGIEIFKAAYFNRIINIAPGNLIGYWPMDETAGVVSTDYSGRGHNGAYTGVTLNNATGPAGRGVPLFDGVNDCNDIYSAGFNSDFDGDHGTFLIWIKVFNAAVWTDLIVRAGILAYVNAQNYISISRSLLNNTMTIVHRGSNIAKTQNIITGGTLNWFNIGLTFDKTADQVKYYYNGNLQATKTGQGAFLGALNPLFTCIGAAGCAPPTLVANGWLTDAAIWNRALGEDDMALLGRVQ